MELGRLVVVTARRSVEMNRPLLISSLLLATSISAQGWRTITNERAHYKVTFPNTWTVWDVDASGTLAACS